MTGQEIIEAGLALGAGTGGSALLVVSVRGLITAISHALKARSDALRARAEAQLAAARADSVHADTAAVTTEQLVKWITELRGKVETLTREGAERQRLYEKLEAGCLQREEELQTQIADLTKVANAQRIELDELRASIGSGARPPVSADSPIARVPLRRRTDREGGE